MTSSGGNTVDVDQAEFRDGGKTSVIGRVLREPLVQFMLIGALLFVIHAAVTPSVSKDRLIEVTPEVRQSIIDSFKRAHEQREPEADELARLVDVWILNEITFREALAQGLDKGDEMIRDRIIQKMRLLIFGDIEVGEPTPQELQEWYEKRHGQYDIPDLVSFIEVPFEGDNAESDSRAVLQQIEAGTESEETRMRAHIFAQRPRPTLAPSFGGEFVDTLVELPPGQWRVLKSSTGWHVVRLDTFVPGRKVELNEVGAQVAQTWKDEKRRILAIAATRDLGKAYVIRRDEP